MAAPRVTRVYSYTPVFYDDHDGDGDQWQTASLEQHERFAERGRGSIGAGRKAALALREASQTSENYLLLGLAVGEP